MIFCRYCGNAIADDSLFCAKCGRKLGRTVNPRVENIIKKFYLRTPYPYFALLALLFGTWGFMAREKEAPADYTDLKWTLKSERKMDFPDDKLYQEGFSLILDNGRSKSVHDIPVDFSATIEPAQPAAEVEINFLASKVLVLHKGKPLPLTLLLSDEVLPGKKRNFSIGGSITAQPPFKVTYEVRERDTHELLASYVVER